MTYRTINQIFDDLHIADNNINRSWMAVNSYYDLHDTDNRIDDMYDDLVEIMMRHLNIKDWQSSWYKHFDKVVRKYPEEWLKEKANISLLLVGYEIAFKKVQTLIMQETQEQVL